MADLDPEKLWTEASDLADDLADAGADPDAVAHAVAEFLDAMVPLDVLLPGVVGVAAEAADGPAFKQVVQVLLDLLRVDPAKREARRQRRAARRAERQARRAGRRHA